MSCNRSAAAVVVVGRALTSPRSTRVSTVAEIVGLVEREAAGDLAGPVGAVADHRQEPVLGQGHGRVEIGAGPLEQAGQAGEGEHVAVPRSPAAISIPEVYRTVRDASYVRNFVRVRWMAATVIKQAGIHCGVTDP